MLARRLNLLLGNDMALDKTNLKNALKDMFESRPADDEAAAQALADIIYDFVKSAEVSTSVSGKVVTGYGTGGDVTGSGSGSLS